jgi:hypothetical protein
MRAAIVGTGFIARVHAIALQAIGLLFYLAHVIRSFIQFVPLISATREEWRSAAENAQPPG